MAIAYVQGNMHGNGATTSINVAVTLASPVATGDMLCVSVGFATGTGTDNITGISDDKGNTYTLLDSVFDAADSYVWTSAYLLNVTNVPQTITATINTTRQFASILVDEFSGVLTSAALDGHVMSARQVAGTGANAVTSGNITTTVPGDLIYGSTVNVLSAGTITAGSGFTQLQSVTNAFMTENLIQGSAGTTAATFTAGNATDAFLTFVMAFQPATGGPPVGTLMGAICL